MLDDRYECRGYGGGVEKNVIYWFLSYFGMGIGKSIQRRMNNWVTVHSKKYWWTCVPPRDFALT